MDTKMFWSRRRWISFEAAVSGTVVLLVIWSENDIGQRILRIIGREPDRRDNSFRQCRTPLLTWALFISSSSTNASPSLMWLPARLIRSSLVWIFHYSQVSAWAPFGSSFNVDIHPPDNLPWLDFPEIPLHTRTDLIIVRHRSMDSCQVCP